MRLCVDYKTRINKIIIDVKHPLPRIKELFAELQGGEYFSKLDFSQAYNQLELMDSSKNILVWNTHKGIYLHNRLLFDTKPPCAIFQKIVEKTLHGVQRIQRIF